MASWFISFSKGGVASSFAKKAWPFCWLVLVKKGVVFLLVKQVCPILLLLVVFKEAWLLCLLFLCKEMVTSRHVTWSRHDGEESLVPLLVLVRHFYCQLQIC